MSPANAQQRILQAATDLFSQVGYNGASTRDIARVAEVNDASVYRYFPSKQDLFIAVVEAELQKLRLRADLLGQMANAADARAAMGCIFELLSESLANHPQLVRLLQFSALEFGAELQPLYQKYLGDLIEGAAEFLHSWQQRGELGGENLRILVLAIAASVVGLQTFYPIFGGKELSAHALQTSAAECAELWHTTLARARGAKGPQVS